MSFVLLLVSIPFVLAACVLLTAGMGLPPLLQASATGAAMLAYLAGTAVYVVRRVRRLGRRFDQVMDAAGLRFTRRECVAFCYEGNPGGKATSARVTPAYRFQPWRVEVSMSAAPGCRAAIGSTRPLLDCRRGTRIRLEGPLAETPVYADVPAAAKRALEDPALAGAVGTLLGALQGASSWELYLQPERVWLRARSYAASDGTVAGWLRGVRGVAEAPHPPDGTGAAGGRGQPQA